MPSSVAQSSAQILNVYQALYGKAPSAALFADYKSTAATSSAVGLAQQLVSGFQSMSSSSLATMVLGNLGINDAALATAVGQLFDGYGLAQRGQILVNMTTLLAGLESDAKYGTVAKNFNATTDANFAYASNPANTLPGVYVAPAPAPAPTYSVTSSAATINEGQSVTYTVSTKNVAAGTYNYTLGGDVKTGDVVGGLTGSVAIDATGTGYITVTAVADNVTDGDENMTITIGGQTSATVVRVLDTSQTPVNSAPMTLTTGVDTTLVGGAANDTYNATQATLTAGDVLSGGAQAAGGADILVINSTGAALGGGVIATGIEVVRVIATGATSVDTTQFTGVTTVDNNGSTAGSTVTVSNLAAIPAVNVTASNSDTVVSFAAGVVAGASDSATVNLTSAASIANIAVTANGVESVTVAASGGSGTADSISAGAVVAGRAVTINSDTLNSLTVGGTGTARLVTTLNGASATTTGSVTGGAGADDLTVAAGATARVSIAAGAGDDIVRINQAIGSTTSTWTVSGGTGTDTLVVGGGVTIDTVSGGNISDFEAVRMTGNSSSVSLLTTKNNVINTVTFDTATGGTVAGVNTGATVNLTVGGSATVSNTAWATPTTDSLTVNIGTTTSGAAVTTGTISAASVETMTLNNLSAPNDTTARANTVTDTALRSLTVTGAGALTLTAASTALATVNLSGVTGGTTFTSAATAGASITGGTGNDNLTGGAGNDTIDGGNGANTITGGDGADVLTGGTGVDRFEFASNATTASTPVRTSTSSAPDTINGFTTTVDKISITGANAPTKYIGTFSSVQAALSAQAANGIAGGASFITGESTLYVFQNIDGTMNVNDMVIRLPGVTAFAEGDLLLGSQAAGATITLTAPAAVAGQTGATSGTSVGGVASTTANLTVGNDIVNSTVANLVGSSAAAGTGSDTLALSITSTAANGAEGTLTAANLAAVTGFETITLANFVNSASIANVYSITIADANAPLNGVLTVTSSMAGLLADGTLSSAGVTFNAGNLTGNRMVSITGGTANDVLTGGAGNDTIIGGAGNDIITGGTGVNNLSGGDGVDTIILNGAATAAQVHVLSGGAGTDTLQIGAGGVGLTVDLSGSTISTFENLDLATNVAANLVTLTGAQYASFTGTVSGNSTDDVITLTTVPTAAISAGTSVNNFSVVEGTTITLGATPTTVILTETGTVGTVTTAILGAAAYSGTWVGWDSTDVIRLVAGNVTAPGVAASVFDFNSVTANLTMTAAQHLASTFTNVAAGTQTITIPANGYTTFAVAAGIDSYVLGAATGNALAVTGITGAQSVNAVTVADTVTFNISGTYTGAIVGEGTNAEILSLAAGADISGATGAGPAVGAAFTGVTGLTMVSGATNTMTAAQFAGLSGTPTAAGVETITLTTGGTVTGRAAIEVYNLGATAANAFTFAATPTAATQTVNTTGTFATSADLITGTLANGAGGKTYIVNLNADGLTDRISIVNTSSDLAGTNTFQVNGFAVANDALQIVTGTVTNISNGGYQAVAAGGNTNVTVLAGGVIEITGSNAADLTVDGDAAAIEIIIANAIGTIATGSEYTVIVYSGANAGIYQLTTTIGTNLLVDGVGFTVELVAIVTGVGLDNLGSQNFF